MVTFPRGYLSGSKCAAIFALLLAFLGVSARLPAQDNPQEDAAPQCTAPAFVARHAQPGQTAAEAADSAKIPRDATRVDAFSQTTNDSSSASQPDATSPNCSAPLAASRDFRPSPFPSSASFSSSHSYSSSPADISQQAQASALAQPSKYPVTARTGKWGGEEWEPAFLQTLGFSIAQNGYRLATEEKTRHALTLETWHRYYLAISGLHTWSDGGKTWTVYVAHPAQGAVLNDIWIEHDPHAALLYFGFNKVYWGERIKAFWWDSAWELQWKFGPFSEASIGNVGLIPGKLGANTIVSSALIGTGLSVGEDMMDRYAIRHWEKHTNSRVVRAFLRSGLNPDRSFANLFRKKWPWYRDMRPTLRDLDPN
jgi:hypothetical protein